MPFFSTWLNPKTARVGPLSGGGQGSSSSKRGDRDVYAWTLWTVAVVGFGLALGLISCCAPAIKYHIIDYPKPSRSLDVPIPDTVMVYHFLMGDSVDLYALAIEHQGQEGTKTLHRWEQNPSDMITDLILRDLEASGTFAKAVDQWSASRYRYALEGKLTKLRGVVSNGKAEAVLEAEAALFDFETPLGARKRIMKKTYTIRAPSVDTDPGSIARAMNLAVRRLSERIRSDILESLGKEEQTESPTQEPRPLSPPEKRLSCRSCFLGHLGAATNGKVWEKGCSFDTSLVTF
ncbi:MAG: ABC-type transport auxiliary lipoprotein family protein [Thermodesulfobacteriota bacterium]